MLELVDKTDLESVTVKSVRVRAPLSPHETKKVEFRTIKKAVKNNKLENLQLLCPNCHVLT